MNCKTCRWSFSIHDHEYNALLMCWPNHNRLMEQIAYKPCDQYQRESGADEVEE